MMASVPEKKDVIKDDVFSVVYSIINDKQTTIYNFDDKNISYCIPFKNELTVLNTELNLPFFTQLELHSNDEQMDYVQLKTIDGIIYSIINKDDDILKLNTDMFKYNYDMLKFFKKIYSDCGFLFVKSTKKNSEIIFTQTMNNLNLFIPFISLIEVNKLERYLYDIGKIVLPETLKSSLNTPTLLYNAQGEIVRLNQTNIRDNLEPTEFIDFNLDNAHNIDISSSIIGFHGVNDEQMSKFKSSLLLNDIFLLNNGECTCKDSEYSDEFLYQNKYITKGKFNSIKNCIKNAFLKCQNENCKKMIVYKQDINFLESIKSEEDYNSKIDEINKCLNKYFFDTPTNYNTLLKYIYKLNKYLKSGYTKKYNLPIVSNFDIYNYMMTKYNITKPVDSKLNQFINLFKTTNNVDKFVYFNIKTSIKPTDIIL